MNLKMQAIEPDQEERNSALKIVCPPWNQLGGVNHIFSKHFDEKIMEPK